MRKPLQRICLPLWVVVAIFMAGCNVDAEAVSDPLLTDSVTEDPILEESPLTTSETLSTIVTTAICGNGICEMGEDEYICPPCPDPTKPCPMGPCFLACEQDCPMGKNTYTVCGNGICEFGEEHHIGCEPTCPIEKTDDVTFCGNNICEPGEEFHAGCETNCSPQVQPPKMKLTLDPASGLICEKMESSSWGSSWENCARPTSPGCFSLSCEKYRSMDYCYDQATHEFSGEMHFSETGKTLPFKIVFNGTTYLFMHDGQGFGTFQHDSLLGIYWIHFDDICIPCVCPDCFVILPRDGCGDWNIDPGEECDDGNTTSGDGCSSRCQLENECGNGVLEIGEVCDDGNQLNGDSCNADCSRGREFCEFVNPPAVRYYCPCGDGVLFGDEECDDGNTASGDGCSATCTIEEVIIPEVTCYSCSVETWSCAAITEPAPVCAFFSETMEACEAECEPPPPSTTCFACGPTGCGDVAIVADSCPAFMFSDLAACEAFCPDTPPDPTVTCYSCDLALGCVASDVEGGSCPESSSTDLATCEASCVGDIEACTLEAEELPDGFRVEEVPSEDDPSVTVRFVSNCTSETDVRYRICAPDGTITVNEEPCAGGASCVDGQCQIPSCREDPAHPDPTDDPMIPGGVVGVEVDGDTFHYNDYCFGWDAGVPTTVHNFSCNEDGTWGTVSTPCPAGTYCEDPSGADTPASCVPLCPCSRTEPAGSTPGFIQYFDSTSCVQQLDFCEVEGSPGTLIRFGCGDDGLPRTLDPLDCPGGCEDGICTP